MKRLGNTRRLDPLPGSPKWVPVLGNLQKTLQKGEYLPLRPLPMFESNFVQVTSRGAPVFVHHKTHHLTMGVAASLPGPVLPDLLLIARPSQRRDCSNLILTRMIPLDLVHLYVHNLSARCLKLRLITGRYYYLELDAPDREISFLFDRWIRLINLLREPATFWAPRTLSMPLSDLVQGAPPASTWCLQGQSHTGCSVIVADPTYPYRRLTSQKRRKDRTLKRRFKSQAVGDSVPLIWSQLENPSSRKKATEQESHPDLSPHRSQTKIQVSGKRSITIRTIFSIFSSTNSQMLPSSKVCSSESEGAMVFDGFFEATSLGGSENSPDISLLVSYDQLDMQQDMEDLVDPNFRTLSSTSLSHATYSPNSFVPAAYSPIPRHNKKARPIGSMQRLWPLSSQKSPSVPATSWNAPFIFDQSQKLSAVHVPSQKAPARPAVLQKTQVLASVPQKPEAVPGPSRKTQHMSAVSQKAPAIPGPSRKTPHVSAISQKAPAIPGPSKKTPGISAISQKAPAIPGPIEKTPCVSAFSQKAQATPGPSRKITHVPAVPQKAVSHPVPNQKSLFLPIASQKALPSPIQYQMTVDPADLGMLPVGGHTRNMLERSQLQGKTEPLVLVMEMRAQKMSLELPLHSGENEMKELMVSRAQEVALEGLKGKGKLEDGVHRMKEGKSLDMPDFKSTMLIQNKKGVKIQKLVVEGAPQKYKRPFSVEELSLSKMMVKASSKELPLRPELIRLPSWLLIPQASVIPPKDPETLNPRQVSTLEGTPVMARKQPQLGQWVKRSTGLSMEKTSHPWAEIEAEKPFLAQRETSKVVLCYKHAPSSPKLERVSLSPIPLPAARWEDVQSLIPQSPISKMESRVFQKPNGESQEAAGMPGQCPLAVTETSMEILMPKLLEIENIRDVANKVEKAKKKLRVFTPWPRPQVPCASTELSTQYMFNIEKPPKRRWPTLPFDARFPNQHQTRNCYQNSLDYHRCVKKIHHPGKCTQPCEYYFRVFH